MATRAGLNLTTQTGEGDAPVFKWDQTDAALNRIYQRDLLNQKYIQNETTKLGLKMGDASKGLRTADMPLFKANYDKFFHAATMLQSPKIARDANQRAYWQGQLDEAYYDNEALSARSKKFETDQAKIWNMIDSKGGVGYHPFDVLAGINKTSDALPVDQAIAQHLDTPLPYMLPARTYPKEDYEKLIRGTPKTGFTTEEVRTSKGELVGTRKTPVNYYSDYNPLDKQNPPNPWDLINRVATMSQQIPAVADHYKVEYEQMMQMNPDNVKSTIEKAGNILGDQFKNQPQGYMKYAMAKELMEVQPKTGDPGKLEEDPQYKRKKEQDFRLLMQNKAFGHQRGLIELRHTLGQADKEPLNINTDLMYKAANNPNQQFVIGKDDKGKDVFKSGYEIVNSYQSAISSDNPSKVQSGVLNIQSIEDPQTRQRLLETMFPLQPEYVQQFNNMYAITPQGAIDQLTDKINSEYQQNLKPADIYNYAIPVYVTKKMSISAGTGQVTVQTIPAFTNPRTRDYGQFHSDVSQQVTGKKKGAGQVQDENFMDMLLSNLQAQEPYLNK